LVGSFEHGKFAQKISKKIQRRQNRRLTDKVYSELFATSEKWFPMLSDLQIFLPVEPFSALQPKISWHSRTGFRVAATARSRTWALYALGSLE